MYQELYQEIIEYFSYQDFTPEYEKTRAQFEQKIGKVFDDHAFFETWIEAFIEYFTFDAILPAYGLAPVSLYYKMNREKMSEAQKEAAKQLIHNRLSIVRFDKKKKDQYFCTEMFDQEPISFFDVDISHQLMLKKDDWMVIRSVEQDGKNMVFGTIWHYPKEIAHILKANRKRHTDKLAFIHDCMAKKVFSENYKHVDLEKIYETKFEVKQPQVSTHA